MVFPSEQGLTYIFGGYNEKDVFGDTWAYDQASQGWEKVQFRPEKGGCDGPPGEQKLSLPSARAGHMMVPMTTSALMCGGYVTKGVYLAAKEAIDKIDCWWLTPGQNPRWDVLIVHKDSPVKGPTPRTGLAMARDHKKNKVYIFAGKGAEYSTASGETGSLLNDCYVLSPASNVTEDEMDYEIEYSWGSCDPTSETVTRPQPRYGAQSVWFKNTLYSFGGIVQNGLRVGPKGDLWCYEEPASPLTSWKELMPRSKAPDPRAFFSMWLSGFKIFVHGGQGPTGVGAAVKSRNPNTDSISAVLAH